jgi:hypothetical protein
MGWSSGVNFEGRTIGYGHDGVCEHEGCEEEIDLGLSYVCGDLAGVYGEAGCGHYFCPEHMYFTSEGQRCIACAKLVSDCDACGKHSELLVVDPTNENYRLCPACEMEWEGAVPIAPGTTEETP